MFRRQLTDKELARVRAEYARKRKSPLVAWLLLPGTGILGGHLFYLKDYSGGILRIIVTLILAAAVYTVDHFHELDLYIGITVAASLLAAALLIDAAMMLARIQQVNNRIEAEIIMTLLTKSVPRQHDEAYSWPSQKNTGD